MKGASEGNVSVSAAEHPKGGSQILPRTFTDGLPLPKVFVFDLDFTLWPLWVDCHVTPPLKAVPGANAGRFAQDRAGDRHAFYPEVSGILAACRAKGLKIAAASRTHTPVIAEQMLRILHVFDNDDTVGRSKDKKGKHSDPPRGVVAKSIFDNLQMYPGDKTRHMDAIKAQLGVGFEEMLFFDDEGRNQNVERQRGVCFWLVRDGVTRDEVDRGVEKWRGLREQARKEAKRQVEEVEMLDNQV